MVFISGSLCRLYLKEMSLSERSEYDRGYEEEGARAMKRRLTPTARARKAQAMKRSAQRKRRGDEVRVKDAMSR